jgi:hypothetical protein
MRGTRHILHPAEAGLRHGHVLQRIKKINRHLKFLVKELAHVRHAGAATAKKNTGRTISLLLCPVMRDGTHQFRM